jgi:glycosyltransferase involved in cell wall biosynthesis
METVGIVTYKVPALKPWDPDTIKRGITGSEEAVIYVSQKLADLGYQVVVFADPPAGSVHSAPDANPRFVSLDLIHQIPIDIAVSWRMPGISRDLRRLAKKVYLWPEDTLHEKVSPNTVLGFDDVLWVSEWQRRQWMSVVPEFARFSSTFGNAINPEEFQAAAERENPYSCIYGSNYARGLEIMLMIWPAVKQHYPKASLDIYYGWQHWGCLAPEKEARMRKVLPTLSDVKEHGLVGHAELNQAYSKTSFWTYPCIMPETFCTTAIRAQMGGAIPVIIEGSALSETVRHGFRCQRPEDYLATLLKAMSQAEKIAVEDRQKMKEFVLQEYTWEKIAAGWAEVFNCPASK